MASVWRSWWWVAAVCSLSGLAYFHAFKEKKASIRELTFRLEEMGKENLLALQEKEELNLRLASQGDPAWIEMILMRDLGVVPEGFLKVHFSK
ncbi:MAG TPA: hypothetical protein VLE89_05970 [Chlamydiales bacterium]|nr:hypothetical protein [Chlamydiales bacterium]